MGATVNKEKATQGAKSRLWVLLGLLGFAVLALVISGVMRGTQASNDLTTASLSELRVEMQKHPQEERYPLEIARRYLVEQRVPEAARELDRALRINSQNPETLYLNGLRLYYSQKPVEAAESLEKALALQPRHAAASLHLAQILLNRNEAKKAMEMLKEYIKLEPMDEAGHYWLGVAAFTSGYETLAIWAMERAVQLAPDVAPYHVALGWYYLNARQGANSVKGEAELREAMRLDPNDWMTRYRLATALIRTNRLREAGTELEEAVRLQPRAYEPYFLLPQVFQQLGEKEKAERYRRKAEEMKRLATSSPPLGAGAGIPRQGQK